MPRFFSGLRSKLILTYTLTTVLALLALEVMLLLAVVSLGSFFQTDRRDYINDVVMVLNPQARAYLQPEVNDRAGLQEWLEGIYQNGYASLPPSYSFDSPAAKIAWGEPAYVIAPDRTVLAQAPLDRSSLVGRKYTPPETPGSDVALEHALSGSEDVLRLYRITSRGKYLLMVPVWKQGVGGEVLGVIVLTLEPPPPFLLTVGQMLLGWVLFTGVVLLMAVAPFAALFGLIMSRGLTRRLQVLSAAADAWSEGTFRPLPPDRSRDEISTLGQRMWNMAERIQVLLQTQQQLATLEERNRLARELHDTVKQQNFATLMQVRAARNLVESNPAEAARRLSDAEALIKTSQQELSLMIAELRPAELEGEGLAHALESYAATWSQNAMIPADFQVQGERRLPLEREQALYRVAQEALSNVARHSHASAARVRLVYEKDQTCLSVDDNGAGFDPSQPETGGFGLRSMKDRLERLGGRLEIESAAGEGTKIRAILPLETTQ